MSDKDLIAEAGKHIPYAEIMDDAKWCMRCADGWPCVTRRLADALEARQPTEDDREVAMSAAREGLMSSYTDHWPDIQAQIVDSILAAGFSRAAVPDAATEEKFKKAEAFDKAVALSERRQTLLEEAEAERDAALAAVERVRAIHRKFTYYELEDSCPDTSEDHREERHHESDEIGEFYCEDMPTGDVVCDLCRDADGERMDWPCPTVAALDGAAEEAGLRCFAVMSRKPERKDDVY